MAQTSPSTTMITAAGNHGTGTASSQEDPLAKQKKTGPAGEQATQAALTLREWLNEMPAALMAPAAMVASVTLQAAMKPPARLTMFPASYAWFRVLNCMTLYTSLMLLLLIWTQRLCGTPPATATARITTALALFGVPCLTSTFAFASSPQDPVAGFARFLPAVVVCVLVYSVALAFEKMRATR